MKEADNGNGNPPQKPSGSADSTSDKTDKDMKGLVYQGGAQVGGSPPTPPPSYPEEEIAGGANPKDAPISQESDTILNFTEKDNRTKMIAIAIIAVAVIAVVAYLLVHSRGVSLSLPKSTTTIKSNTPTTTIAGPNLNRTSIIDENWFYNYTGPSVGLDGQSCGQNAYSSVVSYTATYNALATLLLTYTGNSGRCSLTIKKIAITTTGFKILNVSPATPVTIPPNSTDILVIKVRTPTFNYTGPLSVTVDLD